MQIKGECLAKIDEVKEFINYLKALLIFILATEVGLISWIINNFNKKSVLTYLSIIVIIILSFIVIFINKKIISDIKKLKDL